METTTYAALITLLLTAGAFIFTYFETPRKFFNKGMKELRNIRISNPKKKTNTPFTIGLNNDLSSGNGAQNDLLIYIHKH